MSVTAERVLEESAIDQSGNALKPKSGMLSLLGLNMEISKIDDFWNTRMLKNGIVPTIQPAEGPVLVLSGVDELGAPIGEDSYVPNFNHDETETHLDHYHFTYSATEQ